MTNLCISRVMEKKLQLFICSNMDIIDAKYAPKLEKCVKIGVALINAREWN